jgi:hypothetical protein
MNSKLIKGFSLFTFIHRFMVGASKERLDRSDHKIAQKNSIK